jgi:hypothetical protein
MPAAAPIPSAKLFLAESHLLKVTSDAWEVINPGEKAAPGRALSWLLLTPLRAEQTKT